jgi:acid ceramidase
MEAHIAKDAARQPRRASVHTRKRFYSRQVFAMQELTVDLSQPATQRWQLPAPLVEQANAMLKSYLADLGGSAPFAGLIRPLAEIVIQSDHLQEMESLASIIGQSVEDIIITNLYYDALKLILGCTAFAVDTPHGPMHARNLDWWTENQMLAKYSLNLNYINGPNGHEFTVVGWPGFVGALSGFARGRFAITLNAVLSDEPPRIAPPITLFLRTIFEKARTYAEAVTMLLEQPIASDCLLLITGTQAGEMTVVERTPTRAVSRAAQNGSIVVTNEYRGLSSQPQNLSDALIATSEGRYERVVDQIANRQKFTVEDCFAVLSDPKVRMKITVQQMVFCANTGLLKVRIPVH